MKKILLIPFLLFAALSMAACGGDSDEPFTSEQPEQPENPGGGDDSDDNPDTPAPGGNGRYLVLYASRTNNTERVAQLIQTTLDCDILEVEPETAYDNDYNAMLERSQEELAAIRQGNYPPIKTSLENFDDYDIVFVGYPIWYSSMATSMQTFLHEHAAKLAGKRIALFATSGSSGISTSVSEARSLCPEATVIDRTLLLTSSGLSQMATRVPAWLEEIGAGREESDKPDTPDETSESEHYGRRPHDYRHDGGQCRRQGFSFPSAVRGYTERLQQHDRENILSRSGSDDRRRDTRLCAHARRHHDLCAVGQRCDFLQELVA